MKYLIAIDIDGTLVQSDGKLSNENVETIHKINALGHKVVLATGRTVSGALSIHETLELDTPIIANNGATVMHPFDTSFVPYRNLITTDIIHNLFRKTQPFIKSAYYSVDDVTYAYHYNEEIEMSFNGVKSTKIYDDELTRFNHDASVVVFLIDPKHEHSFFKELSLFEKLSYRIWEKNERFILCEVYDKQMSKYQGIKIVQAYLNMENNPVIAFGDNYNDIEMLSSVTLGIAVANAPDDVKVKAKRVSLFTNDEHVISKELTKLFL